MAKKKESTEATPPEAESRPARTAEELHADRREREAEEQAASGMDRHGQRANQDG